MRKFERFDTSIPIQLFHSQISDQLNSSLVNVSLGGLCFSLANPITIGEQVTVDITHVAPPIELKGTIVWCRRFNDHFDVGLEFSAHDDPFLTRMVEQVCHIENYRSVQKREADRDLTSEMAAKEWIEKFAGEFSTKNVTK